MALRICLSGIFVGSDRYISYFADWTGFPYNDENETYWHGIRLDKGKIVPDIKIAGINCGKCVINILNRDILPNVARDNLINDVSGKVKLAVERAACQYIVSKLTDDKELQRALQDYIDKNYSADNPYYLMD